MSGKKGKSNGVQVFIHKNSPGSELQGEVDKGRGRRRRRKREKERREKDCHEWLEPGVAGHLLLSQEPLVKTQEDISSITVSFPVSCGLD